MDYFIFTLKIILKIAENSLILQDRVSGKSKPLELDEGSVYQLCHLLAV